VQIPKVLFIICKIAGFCLLFAFWIESGEATGFFPIIALGIMTVLRNRIPKWRYTLIIDGIILGLLGQYLVLSIFVISEIFFRLWEDERERGLKLRDTEANKYYELEQLQGDLLTATAQVERMTAASERARIAAEIHDNAGHEIIGAYISFQTTRELLSEIISEEGNSEILELYDTALQRLDSGVHKIREAVHNLTPVTVLGIESLRETCRRFPVCGVQFNTYGDMSVVPIYCWNLLESCLNEALTNVVRHADAKQIKVDLDVTPNIIRLYIENDGMKSKITGAGIGLRNLRHRAAAVGGNISVDAGEVFKVICVVPINNKVGEQNEVNDC
jgi:signal transduction histidine kinase